MTDLRDSDRELLARWVARQNTVWEEKAKGPWRPGLKAPIVLGIDSVCGLTGLARGQASAAMKRLVDAGFAERWRGSRTATIYQLTREGVREVEGS